MYAGRNVIPHSTYYGAPIPALWIVVEAFPNLSGEVDHHLSPALPRAAEKGSDHHKHESERPCDGLRRPWRGA